MTSYTLRDIQSMLGISRSAISSLMASGFVSPSRGQRHEYRFTFQDVVLLRSAYSLQRAQIPARKIVRSLKRLRNALPAEVPLTGLRITAVGNEIAVQEGDTQWQIESGQLLMDFEVKPASGSVIFLSDVPRRNTEIDDSDEPSHWFHLASVLEADDPAEAESAYREAIARAPDYVDPYLNLGCLLCEAGKCEAAVQLYREALQHRPDEPLLHFNLAIALEDMQHAQEALACYERCMQLSPQFADAHYNAARLYEQLGRSREAIRHYSEYRRLQRGKVRR
jgi:tetratricopeptide (TPR) repeat protein